MQLAPNTLISQRLMIRPYREADAEPLRNAFSEIAYYRIGMPEGAYRAGISMLQQRIAQNAASGNGCALGIFAGNLYVGDISVTGTAIDMRKGIFDVDYYVMSDCRRYGVMTEALRTLTAALHPQTTIKDLNARVLPENAPGQRVAKACGFKQIVPAYNCPSLIFRKTLG